MKNLSEKYLNLLSEYEALNNAHTELQDELAKSKNNIQKPIHPIPTSECQKELHKCGSSYTKLMERRNFLRDELRKLYSSWLPPKVYSFFSTIIPWIKKGFKKSDNAEYRLEICRKCDFLKNNTTCQLCGCYMKGKVNIPQASCPIGKWKAEKVKST